MEEISLAPHTVMQIGAAEFHHPTLTHLHEYWNRKRGERNMPSRTEIAPSDLKQHLPWILLADVLPEMKDFRYRLVGGLVGIYFRGAKPNQTVRETFAPFGDPVVKTILYIYRTTATRQAVVRVAGEANWDGNGLEAFETIYLPLSNNGEVANVILSAFVFDKDAVLINRAIQREHGS